MDSPGQFWSQVITRKNKENLDELQVDINKHYEQLKVNASGFS